MTSGQFIAYVPSLLGIKRLFFRTLNNNQAVRNQCKIEFRNFFCLMDFNFIACLTSVEDQTSTSIIFFLKSKVSHDNLAKSSKNKNQFKFRIKRKVLLTQEAKIEPLKMIILIKSIEYIILKSHSLIFGQLSTKFSWMEQKNM